MFRGLPALEITELLNSWHQVSDIELPVLINFSCHTAEGGLHNYLEIILQNKIWISEGLAIKMTSRVKEQSVESTISVVSPSSYS